MVDEAVQLAAAVPDIVSALRQGGCIILPTETVYGLAAAVDSGGGIERILGLKNRPHEKSLPVFVENIEQASELCEVGPQALALMREYWPGPLTVVLRARASLHGALLSEDGCVGLRCPRHWVALELVRAFGRPLACTSANYSGQSPVREVEEARRLFAGDERLSLRVLQTRACDGPPSTVVKIEDSGLRILRQGDVRL